MIKIISWFFVDSLPGHENRSTEMGLIKRSKQKKNTVDMKTVDDVFQA